VLQRFSRRISFVGDSWVEFQLLPGAAVFACHFNQFQVIWTLALAEQ